MGAPAAVGAPAAAVNADSGASLMSDIMKSFREASDLVPPAALISELPLNGYLQIDLTDDGQIVLRGSRLLLDWMLHELARDGWQLELDNIRWCG
jgi:hypothetical protein